MKIGFFYKRSFTLLLNLLYEQLRNKGVDVFKFPNCVCEEIGNLKKVDAVILHPPCIGKYDCSSDLFSTIDNNPNTHFYLLAINYRKDHLILGRKRNVTLLNRMNGKDFFEKPLEFMKKAIKERDDS